MSSWRAMLLSYLVLVTIFSRWERLTRLEMNSRLVEGELLRLGLTWISSLRVPRTAQLLSLFRMILRVSVTVARENNRSPLHKLHLGNVAIAPGTATPKTAKINTFKCSYSYANQAWLRAAAKQLGIALPGSFKRCNACAQAKGIRKPTAPVTTTCASVLGRISIYLAGPKLIAERGKSAARHHAKKLYPGEKVPDCLYGTISIELPSELTLTFEALTTCGMGRLLPFVCTRS